MTFSCQVNSRAVAIFWVSWIILSCVFSGGSVLGAVVTLDSITIYKTHEWLNAKPRVYFQCKGEKKTDLPDVKKVNVSYTFKGEESFQPLTNLTRKKCKRCGFYEKDTLKSDDVFEEWEFCPSDFENSDHGKYQRIKQKEFAATFLCPLCLPPPSTVSNSTSDSHHGGKRMHLALVIIISSLVSTVLIIGIVAGYKYWQTKKKEQEQARFLKLFEEDDDIEDELGLGTVI